MNTQTNTAQLYQDNVLGNYGMPPVTFVRGRGVRVWDDAGKEYLDFGAGIAVTAIGHCHPVHVKAIQDQAATLMHTSNLYRNEKQGQLAAKLNALAGGGGKVFFCNSGAEANEALIKLARLHGKRASGAEGKQYKIVCAKNAFHGRTFGGMSATPKEKVQAGFAPLVPGFAFAELNNLESFAAAIDSETAAVFIETIQGEGGIFPATKEFLQGLRKLCDEKGILLLIDEVQCGVGRSGTFFAFEQAGIKPDAIGMAKGLGGGVPIGAVWIADKHADLLAAGKHGTTFGGTPLISAAALATLEVIESEQLLANVRANAPVLVDTLKAIQSDVPEYIKAVRAVGYMAGVQLAELPAELVALARSKGLIIVPADNQVVRFLPALTATAGEIAAALAIFKEAVLERAAAFKELAVQS